MTTHKENIETIRTHLQKEADRKILAEKTGQHRSEAISNMNSRQE